MKKIGFIINFEKDRKLKFTKELIENVQKLNYDFIPVLKEGTAEDIKNAKKVLGLSQLYRICDAVIVLGGDGTILRVARKAAAFEIPILGINLGTLGYLASVEKSEAASAIVKLLNNDYKTEKRMMLDVFVQSDIINSELSPVLNEVAVHNGVFSRMIDISLEINNQFVNRCRADGIIISTPTGSTAYNLSAGGPILKPDTELISITYVCPHTLYTRPYVISGNDTVKISICDGDYNNVMLSLDGQESVPLKFEKSITIKKSGYYTHMIKTNDLSFYDILRRKMMEVKM